MIDHSKPVRVFKNPKHGCYSIMQGGRIKASAKQIRLKDAEFTVRESGRQRMLNEQRMTIHAYVVGELVSYLHPDDDGCLGTMDGRSAHYNPHHFPTFVDRETSIPLFKAAAVQLDEAGVTYG